MTKGRFGRAWWASSVVRTLEMFAFNFVLLTALPVAALAHGGGGNDDVRSPTIACSFPQGDPRCDSGPNIPLILVLPVLVVLAIVIRLAIRRLTASPAATVDASSNAQEDQATG